MYVEIQHRALNPRRSLHNPENSPSWDCSHCSDFLLEPGAIRREWHRLDDVRDHLELAHSFGPDAATAAREGEDYFFNRTYIRGSDVSRDGAIAHLSEGDDLERQTEIYETILLDFAEGFGFGFSDESDDDSDGIPFPFPGMFGWNGDDSEGLASDGSF